MADPDLIITILDGSLGQIPASVAGASVKAGICSACVPNTVTSFSDLNTALATLGTGPLTEALADTLSVAGGPVFALPFTPSTAGSASATSDNTGVVGTATVTTSAAPDKQIDLKIQTAGPIGTMAFQVRVNGGAYGAPVVTSGTTFTYAVPGTLVSITFAAATYVATDVYTIATTGVVTRAGSGPAATNLTFTASPLDTYDIRITVTTGGALGVGVFTYSVDGGNNVSGQILIPSGGVYAIPGTGVVATFSSATYVVGDVYKRGTTTAAYSGSDATAALTALLADPNEWGFIHVIGMGANAAAAASLAATVDTQMTAAESSFRYVWSAIECPTTEADSALATAFASFASTRIMVCAGDIGHQSTLTGRVIRRNSAVAITSRIAAIPPGEDPAWVGSPKGALRNIRSLYPNGGSTSWSQTTLNANRFATVRKFTGRAVYYVTNGNMMAASGSDFNFVQRRRVMDVACRVVRQRGLLLLNSSIQVDRKTGFIFGPKAVEIEDSINAALKNAIVDTGDASGCSVVVSLTENILATNRLPISVRVLPLAYAKSIPVTIGFQNPALVLN